MIKYFGSNKYATESSKILLKDHLFIEVTLHCSNDHLICTQYEDFQTSCLPVCNCNPNFSPYGHFPIYDAIK